MRISSTAGDCEGQPGTDREQDRLFKAPRLNLTLQDFELEKRIGDGSFSQVVQVRLKSTGQQYALKIVDKYLIVRRKQTASIKLERDTLDRLDYEGIVKLHFTFQDESSLYFGLELCPNGELYDQVQRKKQLSAKDAQFYAAEIVLILEYLRQQEIVHRDLKPENLLLTAEGHLKLTDFGSVKDMRVQSQEEGGQAVKKRAASLVGTADYVAPETLANEEVSYAADVWALGCLVVQMLQGQPPFKAGSEYLTFQKVAAAEYSLQQDLDFAARDLISRLLVLEPSQRLGCGEKGLDELKKHAFFEGIVWETLRLQDAPEFASMPVKLEEEGLDWELNSMLAALPLHYVTENSAPGLLSVKHVGSTDILAENVFGPKQTRT